jgi:hypothetical protein
MATICIQSVASFTHAMTVLSRNLLEEACKHSTKTTDDREEFVQAVFKFFVENGGAEIIKQLVAIKQNAKHDIFKDVFKDVLEDEECRKALEQDWFLFINQIVNFGRPTPAVNGVFTDADQVNHDDGEGVEFMESFDFFLYKQIMKIRGLPTMSDQGLGNAIQIRHDLVNLIIQHFVQTTFTNQINSLKDLVDLKDQLEDELSELKRSIIADDLADPKPKRHKPNADSPANGVSDSPANGDSKDSATAMEDAQEAAEGAPDEDAQEGAQVEEGAPVEEAQDLAVEEGPAVVTGGAKEAAQDLAVEEGPAVAKEVAKEAAVVTGVAKEVAKEVVTAVVTGVAKETAKEVVTAVVTGVAKETNPWVEICDQHNTIMSNINPKQYRIKRVAYAKRGAEMCKNLDEAFVILLIRYVKEKIGDFDEFDVNVAKPSKEMLNTLCDVLTKNWAAIEVGLTERE